MDQIRTYFKKQIDYSSSFLYDRKEVLTAPLWSTEKESLNQIFINPNQPHHQKIYYRNVYSSKENIFPSDVEFSIAYGNILNSGSSTGSFGVVDYSGSIIGGIDTGSAVSESYVTYTQYRNIVSDYETRNSFSSGSFRFVGLGNTDIGPYIWGTTNRYQTPPISIYSPSRVSFPNINSYQRRNIKNMSIRSTDSEHNVGIQKIFFINTEGFLFSGYPNTQQIGNASGWKQVSVGGDHQLAIKEDGTLWSWGYNGNGALGLGYSSPTNITNPTRVGAYSDWEFVCAGTDISFGLRDGGKLYGWGKNGYGILGFGDTADRFDPEQIGSSDWKMIVVSKTDSLQSIIGIKTDGQMYGWGSNQTLQILDAASPGGIATSPQLMDTLGDATYPTWKTVSMGDGFVIAIMDSANTLYGWGNNTNLSQLGLNNISEAIYNVGTQIGSDSDWIDVECGYDFTLALKGDNELYAWGSNKYYQQGRGQSSSTTVPTNYRTPTKVTNINGWTKFAASKYMAMSSIGIASNQRNILTSEDIYVINIARRNYRDKLSAGEWQLSLSGVSIDTNNKPVADKTTITTLVDESVDLIGTTNEYPTYSAINNSQIVYSIYSGSLTNGIHESAKTKPYGLFYPYHGLIVLNGQLLISSASIETKRTPPTASGAFHTSSNADVLFTAISGAMDAGYPFVARTVEVVSPTYCFIRIENFEFNNTLNPSFYSNPDKFIVNDKLKSVPYPFTYITTIGLYNDEDDLLAVAKLSKPIKKTPSTELVVKVKLDI